MVDPLSWKRFWLRKRRTGVTAQTKTLRAHDACLMSAGLWKKLQERQDKKYLKIYSLKGLNMGRDSSLILFSSGPQVGSRFQEVKGLTSHEKNYISLLNL